MPSFSVGSCGTLIDVARSVGRLGGRGGLRLLDGLAAAVDSARYWRASLADEWDGVHLSTTGYLAVSGLLLPTAVVGVEDEGVAPGPARTLLAGWDPGQTWWLADVLEPAGPAEHWRAEEHDDVLRWSRTGP